MANEQQCAHRWRAFEQEEMAALRAQARSSRPSGAWVEGAEQCESCGRVEAQVSWFGQLHRVPVAPKEPGGPAVVQWPTRAQAPGGGMAST